MILILSTRPNTNSAKKTLSTISKKLSNKGEVAYFEDISINLDSETIEILINKKNILNYNFIYFRKIGQYRDLSCILSLYAKKNKIKFIDKTNENIPNQNNKLIQYFLFALNKIDFPKTYLSTKITSINMNNIINSFKNNVILKELDSAQGSGVSKHMNKTSLFKKTKELKNKNVDYIFQEFINNDFEYRILVLGGKATVAETKTRQKNEFRNNISLGAIEKFIPISKVPKKIIQIAEKSAKILTDRICVLEVNNAPQFTLDEKTSPEISELIKFLLKYEK